MNMKNVSLVLFVSALLVTSCTLPQQPSQSGSKPAASGSTQLSVITDAGRAQGVYVNEAGAKFDIVSQEGAEGASVRCVEANAVVAVDQALSSARTLKKDQLKAIVLGHRSDGSPGVWTVSGDDRIHPAEENEAGDNNSQLCETMEIGWMMHRSFGWKYFAQQLLGPDSGKGFIVVGYAENKKGFDLGQLKIDPNTTVAVYWRLTPARHGSVRVSRARIIGQPGAQYAALFAQTDKDFSHWQRFPSLPRISKKYASSFALFFLDWFDLYLTGITAASYDVKADHYLATGPVKGSVVPAGAQTGTATIQLDGTISIALAQSSGGGKAYSRLVIETYPYSNGVAATDTTLRLYDSAGTLLAFNEDVPASDPNFPSARIDYTGGLKSGTYYIKITSDRGFAGPYVIRALSLASTAMFPADIYPGTIATEPWPDGDDTDTGNVPAAPKSISLGDSNFLNRLLDKSSDQSFTPGDIDWCKLVLP